MSGALSGKVAYFCNGTDRASILIKGTCPTVSGGWADVYTVAYMDMGYNPLSSRIHILTTKCPAVCPAVYHKTRMIANAVYLQQFPFRKTRSRITRYMLSIESESKGSTIAAKATNMLERLTVDGFTCLTRQPPNPENHQVTRAQSENTKDTILGVTN